MRANSNIKYVAIAALGLLALQAPANKAEAYVSIDVHIGAFPHLVAVPGYPVYYAPSLDNNLFFYDGLYWLYIDDDWYSSAWYDGPWDRVGRFDVPVFILRVPVRYYRRPPIYFRAWSYSEPPRWGEHWGRDWDDRRRGWDRWDHARVPRPAPLPVYQRDYRGDRYPRIEQQREIMQRHYRYAPGQQSGFQARNESRDEGPRERGGALRPAPNVPNVVAPNPRSHVGPDFGQRNDDRVNAPRPDRRPDLNDRDDNRNDRSNDRSNDRQWRRDSVQRPGPDVQREIAPPAQPRERGRELDGNRAMRPWSNNDRSNDRAGDRAIGRAVDQAGDRGGGGPPMRNQDRGQGRDHDRGRDR